MRTGKISAKRAAAAGLTLTELLIAVFLASLIVLAAARVGFIKIRLQQTEQSMELVQNQAQLALYQIVKAVQTSYVADVVSGRLHVQAVRPGALGEPTDPDRLNDPDTFKCDYFAWSPQTSQLLYVENAALDGRSVPPGRRTQVLATNVSNFTVAVVPKEVSQQQRGDANQDQRNLVELTITTLDPRTNRQHQLGPVRVASRQLAVSPPVGWPPARCQP